MNDGQLRGRLDAVMSGRLPEREVACVEEIEAGSSLTGLLLQVEEEGLRFVNPSPFSRGPQRQL
jgi:hypothetical protein